MIYDISKGMIKSENPKHQPNFDCIRTIGPLFSEEKDMKEKMDKDLDTMKLYLSILKKSRPPESRIINVQNMINIATEARNMIFFSSYVIKTSINFKNCVFGI